MRHSFVLCAVLLALVPTRAGAEEGGPTVVLSGFVDSSMSYSFTPEALADRGFVIGLDQVELDFDVDVGKGLTLRADLQFFPAAYLDPADGAVATFDQIVEQAFARYAIAEGEFFVRVGKWNAPVGFEVIDPTGLWQWSQGLLFTLATPANLTGLAFGWAGANTEVQLWLTNGWDEPATYKRASIGGRVQQSFGGVATVGLSGTYGAFTDDDPKLMIDLDLLLTFGALRIGAQLDYGAQGDYDSIGALLSLNYAFSDAFSMTLRGDYLDREILDSAYKGASLTLAALVNLTKGFDFIAEVRADFPDGQDTVVLGALELLASF